MRPAEVIDCHADLINRLDDRMFKAYFASILGADGVFDDPVSVDRFADALQRTARAAYAYRVTPDMCDLITFAAAGLEDEDTWDFSLAPTGCGFVRFDKPLRIQNVQGNTYLLNWLVWGQTSTPDGRTGTGLWQFNDGATDPDDLHRLFWGRGVEEGFTEESMDRLRRSIGRWNAIGADMVQHGRPLGPSELEPTPGQIAEHIKDGGEFGSTFKATNVLRLVHALWLMLNQTVTHVEDEVPDRAARRRAERMRIPPQVTVIRLRREVSAQSRPEGESHIEWQHRWIVRGHWRWQAYGPNRSERRRIWIHPFVKGPEGAPLKQSEKVYSLDR